MDQSYHKVVKWQFDVEIVVMEGWFQVGFTGLMSQSHICRGLIDHKAIEEIQGAADKHIFRMETGEVRVTYSCLDGMDAGCRCPDGDSLMSEHGG